MISGLMQSLLLRSDDLRENMLFKESFLKDCFEIWDFWKIIDVKKNVSIVVM